MMVIVPNEETDQHGLTKEEIGIVEG